MNSLNLELIATAIQDPSTWPFVLCAILLGCLVNLVEAILLHSGLSRGRTGIVCLLISAAGLSACYFGFEHGIFIRTIPIERNLVMAIARFLLPVTALLTVRALLRNITLLAIARRSEVPAERAHGDLQAELARIQAENREMPAGSRNAIHEAFSRRANRIRAAVAAAQAQMNAPQGPHLTYLDFAPNRLDLHLLRWGSVTITAPISTFLVSYKTRYTETIWWFFTRTKEVTLAQTISQQWNISEALAQLLLSSIVPGLVSMILLWLIIVYHRRCEAKEAQTNIDLALDSVRRWGLATHSAIQQSLKPKPKSAELAPWAGAGVLVAGLIAFVVTAFPFGFSHPAWTLLAQQRKAEQELPTQLGKTWGETSVTSQGLQLRPSGEIFLHYTYSYKHKGKPEIRPRSRTLDLN
jgi:hypothetical protein